MAEVHLLSWQQTDRFGAGKGFDETSMVGDGKCP